ncbi:MAG: cytochrome c nitrite reductase small subunit, partial [Ignavibacteria bacterium]|nr:cytochrome c nitrite reductase small subunit [Ignavibacteria bacterium]
LLIIYAGIALGLGLTVIQISNAPSYLSDKPETCINCHIMTPQYSTWQHSSHREWTNCNDCHVPHNNLVRTYYFKATDGLRHASMFVCRLEPQVIQIKEAGKVAVQENCIRCHFNQISPVSIANVTAENHLHGEGHLCWDCHREVPHGRVNSLASTPFSIVPGLSPVLPKWLDREIKGKSGK